MKTLYKTLVAVLLLTSIGFAQRRQNIVEMDEEKPPKMPVMKDTIVDAPVVPNPTGPSTYIDLTKDDMALEKEIFIKSDPTRAPGFGTGNLLPHEVDKKYKYVYVETDKRKEKTRSTETLNLKTWDGGGDGQYWNSASNWNPDGVPTNTDSVVIDGNVTVRINTTETCGALRVAVGSTLLLMSSGNLTITQSGTGSGSMTVYGTASLYGTLNIAGDLLVGADANGQGVINSYSSGTVNFNGAGNQSIALKGTGSLFNVSLQGAGTTKSLDTALTIDGNLTINPSVTFSPGTNPVIIGGTLDNRGNYNGANSLLTMNSSAAVNLFDGRGSGATPPSVFNFGGLLITGGGKWLYDSITIHDSLVINSGTYFVLVDNVDRGGKIWGQGASNRLVCYSALYIRRTAGSGNANQDMFPSGFEQIQMLNGTTYYDANSHQIIRTTEEDGDPLYYFGLYVGRQSGGINYRKTVPAYTTLYTQWTVTVGPRAFLDLLGDDTELHIGVNQTVGHTALNVQDSANAVGGAIRFSSANGVFRLVANAYQTIYVTARDTVIGGSAPRSIFNDIILEGSGGKDIVNTYGEYIRLMNDLRAYSGVAYLNMRNNEIRNTGAGASRTFELQDGVILYVRGTGTNGNFPDNFLTYTLGPNSTVTYDAGWPNYGTQSIRGGIYYGNLIMGAAGQKVFLGAVPGIRGDFQINAGDTVNSGGFDLVIEGYWTNWSSGLFIHQNNTVIFTGNQEQQIRTGGQGTGKTFWNLTVNKTGGTATLYGALLVENNLYLQSGNFSTSTVNYAVRVNGNWQRDPGAYYQYNTSNTTLGGTGAQSVAGIGENDFYTLTLLNTGASRTITIANTNRDSLHVTGNLIIQDSITLDASNDTLKVNGNFDNRYTGSFVHGTGKVILLGGATQSILSAYTGQGNPQTGKMFNHLEIRKDPSTICYLNQFDIYVNGNFKISSGTVEALWNTGGYRDVFLLGDWINNGTYVPQTDTIHFLGANQTLSGSGANDFYNLRFAGSGTKTLTATIDVNRDVLIHSGVTLAMPTSANIYVGGHWINYGNFQASNGSTVIFTGTRNPQYIRSGGINNYFYNLEINRVSNPQGVVRIANTDSNNNIIAYDTTRANVRVQNDLIITKGSLDLSQTGNNANLYSLFVGGSFLVEPDGFFYVRNNSALNFVKFESSSGGNKQIKMNNYVDATQNLFHTLIFDAPGSVYTLKNDLRVYGNLILTNGTLKLYDSVAGVGRELQFGNSNNDSISITGGHLWVGEDSYLKMYTNSATDKSYLRVHNGGKLTMKGTAGKEAYITRSSGSNWYSFTVFTGGTIAARNAVFEYMDSIFVDGGTVDLTDNFSSCTFSNGNGGAGACLLRIENSQNLTGANAITEINFPTQASATARNIVKRNDAGNIVLVDPLGAFADSTREIDPFNRIQWNFTTALTVWNYANAYPANLWTNPANWTNGVPDATKRALIPRSATGLGRRPRITVTNAVAYRITLRDTLYLGEGSTRAKLTVLTDFSADTSGAWLRSDPTGSGEDTVYVQGNLTTLGGKIDHNYKLTTILNGSSSQQLSSDSLYNLVVQKTGTATLGRDLLVRGGIKILNGTLDANAYDITVWGNWERWNDGDDSVGLFNPRQRTVTMRGTGKTIRGTGTDDFYNLIIAGSDTLKSSINVKGTLTLNSGSYLDVSSENLGITLSGPAAAGTCFVNNGGTFVPRAGTVLVSGSSGDQTLNPNGTVFNNLSFTGISNKIITSACVATGNIDVNLSFAGRGLYIETNGSLVGRGPTNTLSIGGSSILVLRGYDNFPDSIETATFSTGSVVYYQYNNAHRALQKVTTYLRNGTQIVYPNLYLGGYTVNEIKFIDSNLYVNGTLLVYDGDTLRFYTPTNRHFNVWLNGDLNLTNGDSAGIDVGTQPTTITFGRNDGTAQYVYLNNDNMPRPVFHNMVFTGSGPKILYYESPFVKGDVTIDPGVTYLNLNGWTMTGLGPSNAFNLGAGVYLYVRNTTVNDTDLFPVGFETFNLAASSRVYYDQGNQRIRDTSANGTQIEYGGIVFGGNPSTKILNGHINARGLFYIGTGVTLDVTTNNYEIRCGGNFDNSQTGATFLAREGRLIMDGNTTQYIYSGNQIRPLYKLILRGSDVIINQRLDVQDTLRIESGKFSMGGQTIYLSGSWIRDTNAAIVPGTSTVRFTKNGTQTIIAPGADDFYNIVFDSAGTKTFMTSMDINGSLTIGNGVNLVVNSAADTIYLAGSWTNNGSFTHNNAPVVSDGTGGVTYQTNMTDITQANTRGFYDLIVRKVNSTLTLGTSNSDLYIGRNLTIESGNIDVNQYGTNTVYCYGNWVNQNGGFIARNDTVYLRGSGSHILRSGYTGVGNYIFNHLVIDSPGTYTMNNYQIDVRGILRISQGTLKSNGYNIYFSTTGLDSINVENGGTLEINNSSNMYVYQNCRVNIGNYGTAGTIKIYGDSTNFAQITRRTGAGYYALTVGPDGFISARYYRIEFTNANGLWLRNGAQIDAYPNNLSNGNFSYPMPVAGAAALRIDSLADKMTLANGQGIRDVNFSLNPGGGAYNVVYSDATDTLMFINASGPFSGETYERELSTGKIEWINTDSTSVWTGAVSNNWFNPANWTPYGVPDATRRVRIPNTALNDCYADTVGQRVSECKELTIEAGVRRLYLFNDTLTVHGNVNIYGRLTVSDPAALIKVKGNWYNPGTFDHGGGKVRFDSTGIQNLVSGGVTAAKQFGTLEVGSGSIVVVTANAVEIKDSLIIENGGTLDNNNNQGIYIGKVWKNHLGGYYRVGTSTVYFNGTSAQRIYGRDSADFYNVVFENGGHKTFMTNVDIRGSVTIRNSAVVNGNEKTIRIQGNWDNYTTFNAQRSLVIFEGGGQNIYGGGVSGTNVTRFGSLWFMGTGTKTLFTNIEIDSGLVYINRTLNLQNFTINGVSMEDSLELTSNMIMYVRGSNNFPSGFENITISPTSTVYYDVDTNQTIRTKDANNNTFSYGNLYIYNATNGVPSRKTLESNLNARGVLQIGVAARNEQTILDVTTSNYNINVGGYFYNYGLILSDTNHAVNTISFDGNSGQQNIYPEGMHKGKSFYNLVISNTSTSPNNNVVVGGIYDILVRNNLTISNGNFNANGRDITVQGNFNVSTGTFIPGATTLYLQGTNKTWSSNNSAFNNVKITGTYTMLDNITINGNFDLLYGGLNVNGKVLNLNDAVTDNIIIDSNAVLDLKPGSQLRIFGGSALTAKNGAEVKIIGADTAITTVTRNNATGYFGFTMNPNTKIYARYAKFEYVNVSGVYVDQAMVDTANNFSYCTFDNGPTDGIYLTFNNIMNTDTLRIKNANFPYQPPGGSYNVRKNGSTPYVIFQDATGAFEGEAFDYDLTNTIEWIYTTNNRVWTGAANTNWHNPQNWNPKSVPTRENNVIISTVSSNLPVVTADTALAKTLRVSKGTLTLNGKNLVVDGNLTVDSTGTLTVQNATDTIFVAGNWTVTNTYNNGGGVVVFYGSATQTLTSGGTGTGKKFSTIIVQKTTGTTLTVGANDIQIDQDLRILSGTFNQTSGRTITVNREFYNGATFNDAGGTLTLATSSVVNLTTNGAAINNLVINKSGGSVTLQDNLTVNGNFNIQAGSFYANGRTVNFGDAAADAMTISGNAYFNTGSSLRVYAGVLNGSSVTVNNGGYIEFVGTPAQNVLVTRRTGGSDYYRFSVSSGGTIGAKHTTFEYMNGDGLSITTNGINSGINPTYDFDSTTFTNGKSGGVYLKMNGTFVGGHVTMREVNFPFNPGGGAKNVERINATSGDTLIFFDATGPFEGVAYSTPPSTRISWRYSTTNIVFDGGPSGTDSLWSKPENWNPNVLPDDTTKNAIIPAGYYVVYDTTIICNNITINGGTVNVRPLKKMNLGGSLNINSGILRLNPYDNSKNDTIYVRKNITVASGAVFTVKNTSDGAKRSRIYVGENWTTAAGTYNRGTGVVELNGDSTKSQTITTNGNLIFYLIINKNGHANSAKLGSNLETERALQLINGTLDFNGFDITTRFVYQNDALGRIVPGTRKLTYVGTGSGTNFLAGGTGTGKRFYNLEFAHTNPGTVTIGTTGGTGIYVENNLTITSNSSLNSNGNHFYVNGNVDISKNPLAANDTIFLIGSTIVNLIITGDSLGHIVLNKTGGVTNLASNNSVIRGRMNVRNGDFNLNGFILNYGDASTDTILVDGGDLHVDNNSTLRMYSGAGINVRRGNLQLYSNNSSQPANLRIRGTGNYAIQVNPAAQMQIGNGYLSDCNNFNVFGQLYFEPGTTSRFANGTVINIGNNGRLRAVGTDTSATNRVTIKPLTGNYRINFANGSRMIMQNVLVDSVGGSGQYGITLQAGSQIDSMNNVLFRRGTGLAYLSIANDQFYTANGLQFDSAATNRMTYNVSYTSGSGLLTVNNYKGNMSGVFFEQDNGTPPYGRVTWTLNETQTIPPSSTNAFGHRDFTVSNASANLGSTNLQMFSDTLEIAQFSVARYFTIQPTNSGTATIQLFYPKQEENGQYIANQHIWRRRNGQWMMVDTMAGVTITRDSNTVINGERVFSIQATGYNFAAGIRDTIVMSNAVNEASLPVVLAYFRGRFDEGKVYLEWKTESEIANAYWLIQRKEISDEDMNKISGGSLTPEQAGGEYLTIGQIKGAGSKTSETFYEYVDAQAISGKRYAYRIADVSYNGVVTFHESIVINAELPREFGLSQNYPNPFNPTTTIRYQLPVDAKVTIKIYNILGQEVYTLVNKTMNAGYHQIIWNGINSKNSTVASGVYIYRITAQSVDGKQKFNKTRKMMYLK